MSLLNFWTTWRKKRRALQALRKQGFFLPFGGSLLRYGRARRVIFLSPTEEGTDYVDHVEVFLFAHHVVHLVSSQEETTLHLSHCEIFWRLEEENEAPTIPFRLINRQKKD